MGRPARSPRFGLASGASLGLALALLGAGCETRAGAGGGTGSGAAAAPPRSEDAFGSVPDFQLVSQEGREVGLDDLRGRPFAVAAIFTTCLGPCPSMTRHLVTLQEELAGTDVRLVSVSVDPQRDTPEVLARYAEAHGADPERWLFLTGSEEEVDRLVREGLFLPLARAAPERAVIGEQVTHSTRIVAVDRRGRLRGWYDGEDPSELALLRERLLHLAREPREEG